MTYMKMFDKHRNHPLVIRYQRELPRPRDQPWAHMHFLTAESNKVLICYGFQSTSKERCNHGTQFNWGATGNTAKGKLWLQWDGAQNIVSAQVFFSYLQLWNLFRKKMKIVFFSYNPLSSYCSTESSVWVVCRPLHSQTRGTPSIFLYLGLLST
jgi:hypothetical protein